MAETTEFHSYGDFTALALVMPAAGLVEFFVYSVLGKVFDLFAIRGKL